MAAVAGCYVSAWIICFLLVNKSSNCKRLCCTATLKCAIALAFGTKERKERKKIFSRYIFADSAVRLTL